MELKNADTSKNVVSLIEEYINEKDWTYEHFIISSFDWNALKEVQNFEEKPHGEGLWINGGFYIKNSRIGS